MMTMTTSGNKVTKWCIWNLATEETKSVPDLPIRNLSKKERKRKKDCPFGTHPLSNNLEAIGFGLDAENNDYVQDSAPSLLPRRHSTE